MKCWLAAAVAILVCGCNSSVDDGLPATVTARGVILLDGDPVEGASVVFIDPNAPDKFARGNTDSSGRFSLDAFESKPGAVPGSYSVTVSKTQEFQGDKVQVLKDLGPDKEHAEKFSGAASSWKNVLPQKYASITTSEIKVDIPNTGRDDIKIELNSK